MDSRAFHSRLPSMSAPEETCTLPSPSRADVTNGCPQLFTEQISRPSLFQQVSKGKFEDLCIRFTDDFNHFLDDWKPDRSADLMNLCTVSEGSYEICSQTEKAVKEENAKWLLNVKWKMTGREVIMGSVD